MQTPAGTECKFYYEDFYRGRDIQECRLVKANNMSLHWQPRDCEQCPIPSILQANASKYLELVLTIRNKFMGFGRKLDVEAYCQKHSQMISNPYTGCSQCNRENPGLDIFRQALQDDND